MYIIKNIHARQIMDSRGNPTVECDVTLSGGAMGRASVPSGASTGSFEAIELRDGDKSYTINGVVHTIDKKTDILKPEFNDGTAYMGKGVSHAVANVNEIIAPALIGMDATEQATIDEKMIALDGTQNKANLGANAILSVSLAVARAVANQQGIPLYEYLAKMYGTKKPYIMPRPMMNVINGGAHADNGLDAQEFMIIPNGAKNEEQAIRMGSEVFHTLKKILKSEHHSTNVGDEGGFAPNFNSCTQALDTLVKAIYYAGYTPQEDVSIALDMAASEFYKDGVYKFEGRDMTTDDMIAFYEKLYKSYPVISIEDALAEEDWDGWKKLTQTLNGQCQLVGDDLFVTNSARLKKGIDNNSANAILIKPNQIGSLTETLRAIKMAQDAKYAVVISHRSGETEDTTIADLAVATNAGQIKTGSMSRTDRMAKYNQLIRIEEQLGPNCKYNQSVTLPTTGKDK